ncbi:unnamed protein product [Ambrosiozyma monospora]|uniref:Unnamed protein product n=1 Tax=Ambrosiozyma monospora TaxID=43982 RepID=A0A9W6Z7S9_AMBMO|nr:unnamed protein product [Ambrosiozyma monospora]
MLELEKYSREASKFVGSDTAVFVDSTTCVGLEEVLSTFLPGVSIFAIVCDAEIRLCKESDSADQFYFHRGKKSTILIGSSHRNNNVLVNTALSGQGRFGKILSTISEQLKSSHVHNCTLIPPNIHPTVNEYAWKKIIPFICFEVLSIVYPKVSLEDELSASIVKGAFSDILKLAKLTGAMGPDFPDGNSKKSQLDRVFTQNIRQHNEKFPYNYIKTSSRNNNSPMLDDAVYKTESSVCYYNFMEGARTHISLSLHQLLSVSSKHKVSLPYIESLTMMYDRIESLRNENILNCITKESLLPPQSPPPIQLPPPIPMQAPPLMPMTGVSSRQMPMQQGTQTPPINGQGGILVSVGPPTHVPPGYSVVGPAPSPFGAPGSNLIGVHHPPRFSMQIPSKAYSVYKQKSKSEVDGQSDLSSTHSSQQSSSSHPRSYAWVCQC